MATDPVREVDILNGNAARARRQDALAQVTDVVEHEDGSVHRTKATTLVIPEEKRCTAMTVRGARCKAGKMRGLEVCIFHSHKALTDEGLAEIASTARPRLSPRKALQAVVALRAEDLAEAAVEGAMSSEGMSRTKAVLALVDAVDPLVETTSSITLTRDGMLNASYEEMERVYGAMPDDNGRQLQAPGR